MIRQLQIEYRTGLRLLDKAQLYFRSPESVHEGMELLFSSLYEKRGEWSRKVWQQFCELFCPAHPILSFVHQDPMTFRAYSKPRGYAGDAVLIDYLYQHPSIAKNVELSSPIGQAVNEYLSSMRSANSVRWRCELLSRLIDETVDRVPGAEILSVASGHLREAKNSMAVQNHRIKRLVAFDQDKESLKTVEAEKNGWSVECVPGTIRDLIRRKITLGKFDFIYSAGLYDYLNDKAASFLTRALFGMLKKDGRLVIANFLESNTESGYMEAFMGWELNYRTREEFEAILGDLGQYVEKVFFDDHRYVVYVELRKE